MGDGFTAAFVVVVIAAAAVGAVALVVVQWLWNHVSIAIQ